MGSRRTSGGRSVSSVLYGLMLTFARALGEFGAALVIGVGWLRWRGMTDLIPICLIITTSSYLPLMLLECP